MKPLLITSLVAYSQIAYSQESNNDTKDLEELVENKNIPKKGKLYIAPLPVIASNPAYGLIYGVAASGSMFMGDPKTTKMSNVLATATYTTKDQLMLLMRGNIYSNENKWMFQSDYRLMLSSQPTYGLGTGSTEHFNSPRYSVFDEKDNTNGELMNFDFFRIHQTALKEIKPSFYVGTGIHFDRFANIVDENLDVENGDLTHHYVYSQKHGFDPNGYNLLGLSATALYDTRDNIANPYEGRFLNASFRYNGEVLGNSTGSSTLFLEYREYISLSKKVPRNILALWTYANVTTHGHLPYMALPSTAWDQMGRSGRGYAQGRFRGEDLFYAEAEYRFRLPLIGSKPDLLGGVLFANATSVAARDAKERLMQNWNMGYGAGLRIQIQKATRTNIGIDYGMNTAGEGGALYLNLTEYF
ncbi:BamA/TamA family outer membrane protein [Flammeovirga agarivorans]|uniref:BamA/TamA family outer membrane protein n=1 Tax=Flammeovirga agarivorans TaxID=2726742 RepID=A0A7X8SH12_9BACT|nr:BamA/TamA family outer membrane protein [Flammeovirga agarivorans]NLR90103.1 BamA/TamA family outer membrane protein [Flammeovirga agarivorans]